MSNSCIRCGNERILDKTWEETIEMYGRTSVIVHTDFVCADKQCQHLVEQQLLEQHKKRILLEKQKEREKHDRMKRLMRKKAKTISSAL